MNKSKQEAEREKERVGRERKSEGEKERLAQKYEVSHFFATAGSCTEGRMQKKHQKNPWLNLLHQRPGKTGRYKHLLIDLPLLNIKNQMR